MDEQQNQNNSWDYTGGDDLDEQSGHVEPITWSASEYVSHEKEPSWYAVLSAAAAIVAAIVFFITQEILASVTIVVVAFSGMFYAGRKPAVRNYALTDTGLTVDGKHYSIADFRSFSVVEEGAINSIWLKPLGRFNSMMILYFAPEDEEKIANALGIFLPYEQRELDAIDRATRRMRF